MIDRQHGALIFECDTCSETYEPETKDFNEAWAKAKGDGWRATRVGDIWTHSCPQCEADA